MKLTKHNLLLAMAGLVATAPLMGQNAQEVANSLSVPALQPGASRLQLPQVPEGVTIELGGADYEEIINAQGDIRPVLSDTPVQVFFRVKKNGQEAMSKDYEVVVKATTPAAEGANPKPAVIPALLQWQGGQGSLDLAALKDGFTLGCAAEDAGMAMRVAAELAKELGLPEKKVIIMPGEGLITLRRINDDDKTLGKEGYKMEVKAGEQPAVTIEAADAKGLYWGTRTLLQILRTQSGKLPAGVAVDYPRYGIRGFMLDVARLAYSLKELRDVVDTMSWFKMNDLHLHLNDNYIFHEQYVDAGHDPFKESYAAFRLESNMKRADGVPLTAKDVFYTKKQFRELIDYAKQRGVNIVPEINSPAHALAFTSVRPDLIYKGKIEGEKKAKRRCEMLDAANPETLKFVGEVFDEYLFKNEELERAVFDGCVVHVGSDEFFGEAEDYRQYVDGILRHVLDRGYTPRVWGSLSAKRGNTPVVSKGVQMNLWSAGWMKAKEALKQGYDVINTNDGALYIVPFANYYRMDWAHQKTYENWLPNVVGGERLPAGHPQLLGAAFAVWNDSCSLIHNGYGMYDIWKSIVGSVDVLSQKMWGTPYLPDTFQEHRELAARIGEAPGCNALYERTPQEKQLSLQFTENNAAERFAPVKLGKEAVGPTYRLVMEVELTKAPEGQEQVLLSGDVGELIAVREDGLIGLRRADGIEFAYDAKLPVGKRVKLELVGKRGETKLYLDGVPVEKMMLTTYVNLNEGFRHRTKQLVSSFVLPLDVIGKSFSGKIYSLNIIPE